MAFNLSIVVMIVAFFAMIGIEVVKYKKILKSRLTAMMYTILNIAIIAGLVVWKIMEHKSAIPLS